LSYYPYYGRGYVQLTHKENYKKAGDDVGADLVKTPDLAMRPDYAARVMCIGMKEGWFRGDSHGRHTLGRYFSEDVDDLVGARNIINGRETKIVAGKETTVAAIIAGYYAIFISGFPAAAVAPLAAIETAPAFTTRPTLESTPEVISNRFGPER
ncbi:glycoside hydrolase family 19 protein, partial [Rhizobium ruizarguesonis]